MAFYSSANTGSLSQCEREFPLETIANMISSTDRSESMAFYSSANTGSLSPRERGRVREKSNRKTFIMNMNLFPVI
jgi:hypothetical protein